MGAASSAKREAGWEEVSQASGDPEDGRGDVATQCDRRLPGQIQSELPFPACLVCLSSSASSPCDPCGSCDWLQSDRRKAQAGMEAAWKSMEKKEKIPWIKKAAEDQKRYEVQC